MNKYLLNISMFLSAIALSAGVMASGDKHWSYSGHTGPSHWKTLHSSFATCGSGKNQSPVNLTNMIEGDLPAIKFNYHSGGNEILNNGHTVQVNYKAGNLITVDDQAFELKQFHFHSPSENTIDNQAYPMEAHLVHADKEGNLAVIAIMFKQGAKNNELEKAWALMPEKSGKKHQLTDMVDINKLLPVNHDYYRFNGSLTTPPCTEGVKWIVMKTIVTASKKQLEKFSQTMRHPNNRPIQPLNARMVLQ